MNTETTPDATADTTATGTTAADTAAVDTSSTATTDTTATADGKAATGDADKGEQGKADDADKGEGKDAASTEVPDTYAAPEMPEGVVWDQALADALAPELKAAGITQETYNALATKLAAHQTAAITQQWADIQTGWTESITKDAELNANGGALKNAAVAGFAKFGTPAAKEAMNQLGWGNHPELVRLIGKLSLAANVTEDKGTDSAASGGGDRSSTPMYDTSKPWNKS